MKARRDYGYECPVCRKVHKEQISAAICCASDLVSGVPAGRCYECGALYHTVSEAETCCTEEQ